jgi:hypothetical protein
MLPARLAPPLIMLPNVMLPVLTVSPANVGELAVVRPVISACAKVIAEIFPMTTALIT